MELGSGRALALAEYGPHSGRTVLWFHGTPGGRRQVPPRARRLATERNIRLIAVQRPGMGASTPYRYARIRDWAADIEELADRMGVGRFGLIGLSGGGPYVLACAHRLPERVVAGAIVGGVAPARGEDAPTGGATGFAARNRLLLRALRDPLAHFLWATIAIVKPLASPIFDVAIHALPHGDQAVMRRPEMKQMFIDDLLQASASRVQTPLDDIVLFTRHWGFSPRQIRVPIRLWHGDADTIVPLSHARHLAAIIPDTELRVRAREGHLGGLDAVDEILDAITAHWPR